MDTPHGPSPLTAALATPQKVLFYSGLVKLKMLDLSDRLATGISILKKSLKKDSQSGNTERII